MNPESAPSTALLVDDNPVSRAANGRRLSREGYSVTLAAEAGLALGLAERHRPAVIFLHLGRDGSGAAQLIQQLRASDSCRHIPVVMVPDEPDRGRRGLHSVLRSGW